jgi:hypothetical protein
MGRRAGEERGSPIGSTPEGGDSPRRVNAMVPSPRPDGEMTAIDGYQIDLDADAALARDVPARKAGASGRLARLHARKEWMRGYLADGSKPAKECVRASMMAGFNRALLDRARSALGVRRIRLGFAKRWCYDISLPEAGDESPDCTAPVADAHTPPYSAPNSRAEYAEYAEYAVPIGPAPATSRDSEIRAVGDGDKIAPGE